MAVDFYRHALGDEEKDAVRGVLDSLFLTTGQKVYAFEKAFEEYLGVPAVVCTAHATASLHIAMLAAEIGPGDEVVTTPMTFLSSANAVLYAGGTPVFADVDPATANIDPDAVEAAITPRTKAIVAVDLYGLLADMKALRKIADRYSSSSSRTPRTASRGDATGTARGSSRITRVSVSTRRRTSRAARAARFRPATPSKKTLLRQLGSHGMSRNAADRYAGKYQHWDMERLGYKYNLSDVAASLLLPQLPKLAARLARREEICRRYEAAFRDAPGITFPDRARGRDVGAPPLHDLGRAGGPGRDPRGNPGARRRRRGELPRRAPHVLLLGTVRVHARHVPERRAHRRLDDHDPALARDDGREVDEVIAAVKAAVAAAG